MNWQPDQLDPTNSLASAKPDFLAKISHELRTPLTSILGVTELLEYGVYGPLSREQKDALGLIVESSRHMVRLVNDLLEQSRLESGALQLDESDFVVEDLINRLRVDTIQAARLKGLSMSCSIDPDVPAILRGDAMRVYQILRNLVDNAIKYTEKGKIDVKVVRVGQDHYAFEVSDTGIGIPEEKQALIYEPFLRIPTSPRVHVDNNGNGNSNGNGNGNGNGTGNGNGNGYGKKNGSRKSYGQVDGFGLGLAIVKQLVALMDGEIVLESKEGQGSVFTAMLHLEPAQA